MRSSGSPSATANCTAWKVDKGIASRHDAYMAKIHCTELGFEAADRCMQFHGASGLSTEMPIEAMWRRSRSYLINEAIRNYVELHAYQDALVRQGLAEMRKGRVVSHEEVVRRLKKTGRASE